MRLCRLILLACVIAPALLAAQSRTFDVGASHVSQTNQEPGSALTLGARLDAISSTGWLRSSALAVVGTRAQSSVQLLIGGSHDLGAGSAVHPFVGAAVSGFAENGTGGSLSAEASSGVRYAIGRYGVSVAGAAGAMSHHGAATTMLRGESDAWMVSGHEQLSANVAITSTAARFDPQARLSTNGSVQQYFDVGGAWRHAQGPLSFGFAIGGRNETAALRGGVWQSSDVELWLEQRLALVVSGGNTIADVRRGIPRTTYMTVALRFANRPHRRSDLHGPRILVERSADRGIDDSTSRRIEIVGVSGMRVELMADFTRWEPVELEGDGGVWRLQRAITPGLHRVAIRIDGGPWITPVNLPSVEEELGGRVGLLTVP